LLKHFSDIPKDASGDVFGKIYEYFLGKFAMSEGQKGGEFFTPTSVVRLIVEVIEPFSGKILDPACGSGGMFVQSARFVQEANHDLKDIYVCGQEFMGETVRLAKMNLLVNNLRGEIMETNSYDSDPHESYGKFDFVMANPPFNISAVKETTVKDDKRFYTYGLPKNRGKKEDKIPNANYLWISLFATSLNENGRAGFVMPNSASDARTSEYEIRKKIVDSGIVDCMVNMPSNMFLTVTLPATLWFFDKQKVQTDRKDKILFLDARNVYNQIDRAHREWTEEQQQNLATIVRLYRGETDRYLELIDSYLEKADTSLQRVKPLKDELRALLETKIKALKNYLEETKAEKRTLAKKAEFETLVYIMNSFEMTEPKTHKTVLSKSETTISETSLNNDAQLKAASQLELSVQQNDFALEALKKDVNKLIDHFKTADKNAKLKNDKTWAKYDLIRTDKQLEEVLETYAGSVEQTKYWHSNLGWLQTRFPEAKYQDVVGLCKISDRKDYVEEQDYSLNAGRYVGVLIEDDNVTDEDFIRIIKNKTSELDELNSKSLELECLIKERLYKLL
jgi:type I restriction enzyme M protein